MTLQPQFLPWMSDKKWEIPASFEGWMKPWGQGSAWPVAGPMAEVWGYWVDAGQRSVLFWDVLRKRGNQALEHMREGKPPVLIFDYEMVLDGRDFERPVNYSLVRILPEPDMEIDPTKRPFVIVDPRAPELIRQ